MEVSADFARGVESAPANADLRHIVGQVQAAGQLLEQTKSGGIVSALDRFSHRLMQPLCCLRRKYPASGVPYVAHWCRRANIDALLRQGFFNPAVLDEFVPSPARQDRLVRAYPRGLAAHWMAGNVPTLGFLSLIQGLLTKNGNVIRVSSRSDRFLADLMGELRASELEAGGTSPIADSVAVVRYDHEVSEANQYLSSMADIRIIWGGDSAVAEIRQLPAKLGVMDLIFANKISIMLIDRAALAADCTGIARRAASDISTFEQKACASPHTIFIEAAAPDELEPFALELKNQLQIALRNQSKVEPSSTERSAILNLRAEYDMFHRAWYSNGVEYSILADDDFRIGPAIGNRTIFLRRTDDLARVAELVDSRVQTVAMATDPDRQIVLSELMGSKGVQRFTRVGAMTHFEIPWDGYLIPQQLVRWTSRPTYSQEHYGVPEGSA